MHRSAFVDMRLADATQLISASDLQTPTNKLCSVLFGVTDDWYKGSRCLLLSAYSTVEICWHHSTFHQSSSYLSIVLLLKFKKGLRDPNHAHKFLCMGQYLLYLSVYQTWSVYCTVVDLFDVEIWVRDHSKSLKMVPFKSLGRVSYSQLWPYLSPFRRNTRLQTETHDSKGCDMQYG